MRRIRVNAAAGGLALSLALINPAWAQSPDAGSIAAPTPGMTLAATSENSATPLNPVVVTATRTPQTLANTLAATTVITRADIERMQANSVAELLADTPSVSIANSGGPGKLTSIFLRGTNSDQVLVLVDGVRFGSASSGLAAIQDLPVSQIERIEIVRGPRSSLYGADAVGGVIQIFTRNGSGAAKNKGLTPTPYFSVGGGRYNTYQGQAGISAANQKAHYNLSVSGMDTSGFNACTGRPFSDPAGGAGCFADEPDHDGYSRVDGSLNAGYRFDDGLNINANYLRAAGDNQYDGTTANQSDTTQEVYGLSGDAQLLDFLHSTLSLGHSRDISDDHLNGAFASRFETQHSTVSWQNDFSVNANNLLTAGIDYRQDEVTSSVDFARNKRSNKGLFGEYQGTFGRSSIDLAARGDDNQQFGQHATGSATYGFRLTRIYTLTASYGNAFKAPTFNDLYYPNFPDSPPSSNPDLHPEKSRTGEVGIKATPGWGHWGLHAYQTDIDDLITLDENFTPQNLDKARIRGVEGDVTAYVDKWRIGANGDWLNAENRTRDSANHGNDLPRRPDYTLNLDIDRDLFKRFSAGATGTYEGSRYDDIANQTQLGGYPLLALRGEVRLTDAWRLQAKLSNVLGHDYQTVRFYNQPGRSVFFTLRYAPGGT